MSEPNIKQKIWKQKSAPDQVLVDVLTSAELGHSLVNM
jgi:hypothetical protein